MRLNFLKSPPTIIAAVVILLTCLLDLTHNRVAQRLEWITYDARARYAQNHPGPFLNATNLGTVEISDQTIAAVKQTNAGSLGYGYGLYWPRNVYADALKELEVEGAKAVALDVLLSEPRPDSPPVTGEVVVISPGRPPVTNVVALPADEYFSRQLAQMGNVILAGDQGVLPDDLFTNDASMVGNITAIKDDDGVLRRDEPFETYRVWHPLIRDSSVLQGLELSKAKVLPHKIIFPRKLKDLPPVEWATDDQGRIDVAKLSGLSPGKHRNFRPFREMRVWSMGIALAAADLKLDLAHPEIESSRIILHGPNGLTRTIPRNEGGTNTFYIDWSIPVDHPALTQYSFEDLLSRWKLREMGIKTNFPAVFKDKLVVIGSTASGNDLTDLGATPLESKTFLFSKHWNVANSVITGHFVTVCPVPLRLLLIVVIGALSTWVTLSVVKPWKASLLMLLMAVIYVGVAMALFVEFRYWLPIILPLVCAGLVTHGSAVTYRVVVEQAEQKRVRGVFQKMLAPEVVHELLAAKNISLGGSRREITIYFADVRGFTEFTDLTQARAEEFVRENNLNEDAADAYHDMQARETLNTVSLYLGTIADTIIKNRGTLDKYIGDCVMAFWGGPIPNPHHARDAVRSAIAAQLALHKLNQLREKANKRKERENASRAAMGLPPDPPLPLLSMGTGINTGVAIMGLMGSEEHKRDYTVFGREVNLASRLEGLSGHSRIIISESTLQALKRDDPDLAATCIALPPREVKGIRGAITIYEVPWKPAI